MSTLKVVESRDEGMKFIVVVEADDMAEHMTPLGQDLAITEKVKKGHTAYVLSDASRPYAVDAVPGATAPVAKPGEPKPKAKFRKEYTFISQF